MKFTSFISSAFKAVLPIALFTAMTAFARNKSEFSHTEFTMPADRDSVRVNVKFNAPASGEMIILMDSTNDFIRIKMSPNHQEDLHKTGERKGKKDTYYNCGLRLDPRTRNGRSNVGFFAVWWGYESTRWFTPFFDRSMGLYDHKQVTERMPGWKKNWWNLFEGREMVFDFEYDKKTGSTMVWLDRQFAGRVCYEGKVKEIKVKLKSIPDKKDGKAKPNPSVAYEAYTADRPLHLALPAIEGHTHETLRENARLVIDNKYKKKIENMIEVWPVETSCDSGLHVRTQFPRSFGSDPFYNRNAWTGGPEYMHWTVPGAFYTEAYILCADLKRPNTVSILGTMMGRYGASVNSETVAMNFTDMSEEAIEGNKDIKTVGTLKYVEDGKQKSTPLYLVRQRIDIGKMLHVLHDKAIYSLNEKTGARGYLKRYMRDSGNYLNFEIIGQKNQRKTRSSIQVFGCVLKPAPYTMDIVESERGNIFHNDEKPETGVEVKAMRDGVKGSLAWRILDDRFKLMREGEIPFSLAKAGDKKLLKVDLAMSDVGWYMLEYEFKDARGTTLVKHDAAFTLLGDNTREAGFESPYACWPQGTAYNYYGNKGGWGFHNLGKSGCNPCRAEVAEMMHKAGYHTAWAVPAKDENEFPEYKITQSTLSDYCNNRWPKSGVYTAEDLKAMSNRLDNAVIAYREQLKRYPHCHTIQILHEQGGKIISKELLGKVKVEDRKPYDIKTSPHLVVWATESAKRFRKEFPGFNLQIGNGSSSCEMIGYLLRNGFDMNLVDTLGIESKGFWTMPELSRELEAPGMLWALKKTAELYGYTNMLVNACNEYVFRPERPEHVARTLPYDKRMLMTNYVLRDTLVSLAHGCWTISIGHLEDCDEPYYHTNWGAGGQCTFYPFSYPKRMFTALATLTKVIDKPKLEKCHKVRKANAVYAVEFLRQRAHEDYVTAIWSASAYGRIAMTYPAGATVTRTDWQGRTTSHKAGADGKIVFNVGPTPSYLVCDAKLGDAEYLGTNLDKVPEGSLLMTRTTTQTAQVWSNNRKGFTLDGQAHANFKMRDVRDELLDDMKVAELVHDREWSTPVSEVIEEKCDISYISKKREAFDPEGYDEIGIWVKGNGSFGKGLIIVRTSSGIKRINSLPDRCFLCYDGWRFLRAKLPHIKPDKHGKRWIEMAGFSFGVYRNALNPRDMVPVQENIRIGDVYLLKKKSAAEKLKELEEGFDAMKYVDEKDL